jgi:hypothetical protein
MKARLRVCPNFVPRNDIVRISEMLSESPLHFDPVSVTHGQLVSIMGDAIPDGSYKLQALVYAEFCNFG